MLRAWLAPLLAGSAVERVGGAQENLRRWVRCVPAEGASGQGRFPISLEIALAQGFKHAANRRPAGRGSSATHGYLAEQAAYMLEHARFWFSRLTLVQALCLWALPVVGPRPTRGVRRRARRPAAPARTEPERRAADPAALVGHWLSSPVHEREHPFVAEARKLAEYALEKGEPERYLWIDESGVVTKIGGRPPHPEARRKHNLWIPPSTGWAALHPRAQRLVADVLILLNLAERGTDRPEEREARLARAMREDLPACLAGDRRYLEAERTVGRGEMPVPGARCRPGCPFDLCPYPPKGPSQTYRVELSEAFCRRQRVLLGRWYHPWRRTARWQGALPGELRRFWRAMETRARR